MTADMSITYTEARTNVRCAARYLQDVFEDAIPCILHPFSNEGFWHKLQICYGIYRGNFFRQLGFL